MFNLVLYPDFINCGHHSCFIVLHPWALASSSMARWYGECLSKPPLGRAIIDREIASSYLDNGVEVTLKAGDVCVQRGTIHGWDNRTDKPARVFFVLTGKLKKEVRPPQRRTY